MSNSAIVHYNDGSIFVGRILEESTLEMELLLTTNDTITLNKAFIHRIKRGNRNISLYGGAKFHYTKGVFVSLQIGGNITLQEESTDQVDLIVGYRFNKKWATGIGIGSSYNSSLDFGTTLDAGATPVFLYGRYYPIDKKIKPFVAAKVGWGFPSQQEINGDHQGGALFQPEIGVNFSSYKRIRVLVSLGQQLQNIRGDNLDFDSFGNPIRSKFDLWFNRTVLKLGVEWK